MSEISEFKKWQRDMIERAFGLPPYADDNRDLAIGTLSGMDMARDWILNKAKELSYPTDIGCRRIIDLKDIEKACK